MMKGPRAQNKDMQKMVNAKAELDDQEKNWKINAMLTDDSSDIMLGVKQRFGDETAQFGPLLYLNNCRQEKWLEKKTKLSEIQYQQKLVKRNNKRLNIEKDDEDEVLTGKAYQKK